MIGSQILRSIVTDARDSTKYFLQSFDLITQSGHKVMSKKDQRLQKNGNQSY